MDNSEKLSDIIVLEKCEVYSTKLEFLESDVSSGKTEVKEGKFVEFISWEKGYFLNWRNL